MREVMAPTRSSLVTQEMIDDLAYRVAHEPLKTREANKKLTGEWIVYVRHEEKNYYLC